MCQGREKNEGWTTIPGSDSTIRTGDVCKMLTDPCKGSGNDASVVHVFLSFVQG